MRIGIIGSGMNISEKDLDWSIEDLVFNTVKQTLGKYNMTSDDVDTVVQAADDIMDGIAINHVYTVEPSGSFLKEESKVERDGAWAVQYAMARLMVGKFETAMVVAYSKGSQIDYSAFTGMAADPFYLRPVGADGDSVAALQAQYYSDASGATQEDFANVAVKNRKNGLDNGPEHAKPGGDYTTEQVLGASPIATPLTELTAARTGDGCVVMLLATEEYIKAKGLDATGLRVSVISVTLTIPPIVSSIGLRALRRRQTWLIKWRVFRLRPLTLRKSMSSMLTRKLCSTKSWGLRRKVKGWSCCVAVRLSVRARCR